MSVKKERKMEKKKKVKTNTTIRDALKEKNNIIKSIKWSELKIVYNKNSPLLMLYCRSLCFANHIRRSRQIEDVYTYFTRL